MCSQAMVHPEGPRGSKENIFSVDDTHVVKTIMLRLYRFYGRRDKYAGAIFSVCFISLEVAKFAQGGALMVRIL